MRVLHNNGEVISSHHRTVQWARMQNTHRKKDKYRDAEECTKDVMHLPTRPHRTLVNKWSVKTRGPEESLLKVEFECKATICSYLTFDVKYDQTNSTADWFYSLIRERRLRRIAIIRQFWQYSDISFCVRRSNESTHSASDVQEEIGVRL